MTSAFDHHDGSREIGAPSMAMYEDGFDLHPIRERVAQVCTSEARDAVVTRLDPDGGILVADLETGAPISLWHYERLDEYLEVGSPVAVNRRLGALCVAARLWVSVIVDAAGDRS